MATFEDRRKKIELLTRLARKLAIEESCVGERKGAYAYGSIGTIIQLCLSSSAFPDKTAMLTE
jgi:hypothetical protein